MALYFTRNPFDFNFSKNPIPVEVGTTTAITETLRLGFKVTMKNLLTGVYEEIYSGTQRFDENGQSLIDLSVICDPHLEYYVARPYDVDITTDTYVIWKKQCRDFKVTVWETTNIPGTTVTGSSFKVVKGGTNKETANDEEQVQANWFDIGLGHPVLTNRTANSACREQELFFASFLILADVASYKFKGVSTLTDGTTITGYINSGADFPSLKKGDVVCLFYPISNVSSASVVSLKIGLVNGSNTEISRRVTVFIKNRPYANSKTLLYLNSVGGTEVLHLPYNLVKQAEVNRDTFDRMHTRTPGSNMLIGAESLQHNQLEEVVYTIDSGAMDDAAEFNSLREFTLSPVRYEIWANDTADYLRYLPVLVNTKKQTLIQNRDRLPVPMMVEIIHALKNSHYSHRWNSPAAPDLSTAYADIAAPIDDYFYFICTYVTGTPLAVDHDSTQLYIEWGDGTNTESSAPENKSYTTSAFKKVTVGYHHMHPLTEFSMTGQSISKLWGNLPAGLTMLQTDTGGIIKELPVLPSTLETLELPDHELTALDGMYVPAAIQTLDLANNKLTVADVNYLLTQIDALATSGGVIYLSGQTPSAAPSGAGSTAKTNLIGRGWTVNTD